MKLNILLFAGLADRLGADRMTIELDGHTITVGGLLEQLMKLYPAHADVLKTCFMAKNKEYAAFDQLIEEQDELALIPPVSGGQEESIEPFVITQDPIQVEEVTNKVRHPNHGAVLSFIGTTRELTEGRRTIHLEYDAYIPMAVKTLRQIGDEINVRWPGALCHPLFRQSMFRQTHPGRLLALWR